MATIGTTSDAGSVDPLPRILEVARRHGPGSTRRRAYGGYFRLAGNLAAEARAAYDLVGEADRS